MDEAEAEAVLVALSSEMMWRRDKDGKEEYAFPASGWYRVKQRRWFLVFRGFRATRHGVENSYPGNRRRYKSLTVAKAACERHNATGEWE